jgi:hypothetical protein
LNMSPRPKSRIPVLVSWSPCNPLRSAEAALFAVSDAPDV